MSTSSILTNFEKKIIKRYSKNLKKVQFIEKAEINVLLKCFEWSDPKCARGVKKKFKNH